MKQHDNKYLQAYGSVSLTEVVKVMGCGAGSRDGAREAESDTSAAREMVDLTGGLRRHRAMKTSCTSIKPRLPEPVQV